MENNFYGKTKFSYLLKMYGRFLFLLRFPKVSNTQLVCTAQLSNIYLTLFMLGVTKYKCNPCVYVAVKRTTRKTPAHSLNVGKVACARVQFSLRRLTLVLRLVHRWHALSYTYYIIAALSIRTLSKSGINACKVKCCNLSGSGT